MRFILRCLFYAEEIIYDFGDIAFMRASHVFLSNDFILTIKEWLRDLRVTFIKKILFPLICTTLIGCPLDGEQGMRGADGRDGDRGLNGLDGIHCWDTNQNRINDNEEDINGDSLWDVKDCTPNTSASITQNVAVDFNHQHICSALANLGQYPEGCPSATHVTPNITGNFTQLLIMLPDGNGNGISCNYPPSSGLLTLEKNPANQLYYWKLSGGFIANTSVLPLEDELGASSGNSGQSCLDKCANDPNCIASLAESRNVKIGGANSIVYDCAIFHHSDTIMPYERKCDDNFSYCAGSNGVLLQTQRWGLRCP